MSVQSILQSGVLTPEELLRGLEAYHAHIVSKIEEIQALRRQRDELALKRRRNMRRAQRMRWRKQRTI